MTQLIGLREKTLLFAEDDDIIRYNTLGILSVFFKKVITAKDGQEALEKYVDEKPDIIMTDIKMPIMDGLDFITEVRNVDVFTPIVLFSAYNEQRYLAKAINLKVEGLILKPIKLDELFAVLARCAKSLGSTNE